MPRPRSFVASSPPVPPAISTTFSTAAPQCNLHLTGCECFQRLISFCAGSSLACPPTASGSAAGSRLPSRQKRQAAIAQCQKKLTVVPIALRHPRHFPRNSPRNTPNSASPTVCPGPQAAVHARTACPPRRVAPDAGAGVPAPMQFLVFAVSPVRVLRFLATGSGYGAAALALARLCAIPVGCHALPASVRLEPWY